MSEFNRTMNIYVESGEAQKSYDVLAKKQDDLKAKMDEYTSKGREIPEKLTKQLDGVTAALERQAQKLNGELSPSYRDLTGTVAKLTAEVSRMSAQDAGFAEKTRQLEEAKTAANEYRNSVINVGAAMEAGKHGGEGFAGALKEIAAGFTLSRIIEKTFDSVKEFFSESIKESQAMQEGQEQLKTALENVGRVDALEVLNKQAEDYSKKFSYLYVPEITKVQEKLVTFGRLSMKQINDVLPVIINFSAKTKKSMEESTTTILSAMEGNGRALKQFGLEIVKDGTFVQNYGLVMNQLAARVDGAAAAFDRADEGGVARYTKNIKELQETVGSIIRGPWMYMINGLSEMTRGFNDLIKPQKDEVQVLTDMKERMDINLTALQDTNISAETRKRLITETNEKYGEYLPHLLTEKSSLEDIKAAQEGANKAMLLKIYMMGYQKELTKLIEKQAEVSEKAAAAEVAAEQAKIKAQKEAGNVRADLDADHMNEDAELKQMMKRSEDEFTDKQVKALKDKYAQMAKDIGHTLEDLMKSIDGGHDDNKALRTDQPDKKRNMELEAYQRFYAELKKQREESDHAADSDDQKEIYKLGEKYKEELGQLTDFFKKGVISRKQYNADQQLLNQTYANNEKAMLDRQAKAGNEQKYASELKQLEAMYDQMRELNGQRLRDGEISEKQYNARLIALDATQLESKMAIADKYASLSDKAKEDEVKFYADYEKKETQQFLDEIAKRKAAAEAIAQYNQDAAKQNAAAAGKGAKDETTEKLKANDEWYKEQQTKWEGNEEVLTAITADYQARRNKIIQEGMDQALSAVASDIKKYGDAAGKAVSDISKIMENNENAQLKHDRATNTQQLQSYKDMLDSKKISQKEYNQMVESANAEMAKKEDDIKRKQFERNKAIKIAEGIINTAAAVLQALANNPPPASYAMAAIAGALGAVEVGVIASEKYATGTESFGDKGPMGGQPHSAGGNPIIDGKTGQKIGEVERGEAIIPHDATRNNPDVIRQLLTTGRNRNLVNTLRPVHPLDQARNLGNIAAANHPMPYHAIATKESGSGQKDESDDQTTHLLKRMADTLDKSHQVHERIAAKPGITIQGIQEMERTQQYIISKKGL